MLVPLPFLTALVVFALALRFALATGLPPPARGFLAAAGLFASAEAVLVGLRFGYDMADAIAYQRVLPLAIGPFLYLSFLTLTAKALRRAAFIHLGAALTLIAFFAVRRAALPTLDVAIIASYALYAILMFRLWRAGPDALARARLSEATTLRLWLLNAIGLMIFTLVLDAVIALAFAYGLGENAPLMISLGAAPLTILFLYALTRRPVTVTGGGGAVEPDEDFAKIDRLMRKSELFRDPDLTLSRLARRLGLPARAVSQAINRATGLNVSHYVNQYRIAAAAEALTTTTGTIETIAQDSGFLSRSNFYREFQRIHGVTPAAYRKAAAKD